MAERHNALVCSFDPSSPRITAWDIHEWMYVSLKIPDYDVRMIQTDGVRRQVFIKLLDHEKVMTILHETGRTSRIQVPYGRSLPGYRSFGRYGYKASADSEPATGNPH